MAGIRDIKRKIVSVENTQKVTKAMKMVSAAKMRRANDAIQATLPYAEKMSELIDGLMKDKSIDSNKLSRTIPLLANREVKKLALFVVNSDRGLCGAFNLNIVKAVSNFLQTHSDKEVLLYIVGKNAFDFFKKRTDKVIEKWVTMGGKVSYESARQISDAIVNAYVKGDFDEMHMVYNNHKAVNTDVEKLLPVSVSENSENEQEQTDISFGKEYKFEPEPEKILQSLIPRYITFTVYRVLLESAAGEHKARMVAMDNATRNVDEMIKKLQLNYNKARQAAITKDLLDIINGAEALK